MARAAKGVRNPGIKAMPAPHIEKAERKQSHSGVFIAVAQVFKLRNLGHPWRMKAIPMKRRKTNNAAPPGWDKPVGTSHSTTVISKCPMATHTNLRRTQPGCNAKHWDREKPATKVRERSQRDCDNLMH